MVEEIVTVVGPGAGVFGLDMSEDEVARARERYPAATFCVGRAQSLPFGDNSFDAVLSHFAFMLMVPVIPVVSEIERVLRPGGLFACALSSLARAEGDLADVLRLRNEIEATRPPELPTFDPRQATPEGIAELFAEAGSTRQVSVRTVPISCEVDAHGAGRFLDGLYFTERLDEEMRNALQKELALLASARGGTLRLQQMVQITTLA